jgi:hypothetical protein
MKAFARTPASLRLKTLNIQLLPLLVLALFASVPALVFSQRPGAAVGVHGVDFGQGGRMLGSYTETGNGTWDELNARGVAVFHYQVTRRDQSAIYLLDHTRGCSIKLDFIKLKVIYNPGQRPDQWRELYDILPAPAPQRGYDARGPDPRGPAPRQPAPRSSQVTGYNVLWFKAGSNGRALFTYVKAGGNTWDELNPSGQAVHHYKVTGQSQETLTLFDYTRNLTLELDFRSKTSLSTIPGRPHQNMYEIVSAGDTEMPDNSGGYDR